MTTYAINGKEVTEEEFRSRPSKIASILESHQAPGGHAPYWGTGHESIASSVPYAQAEAHSEWIKQQGLKGVEVKKSEEYSGRTGTNIATVVTHSPENRRKYLEARGLVDANSAGSGGHGVNSGSICKKADTGART